MAHVSVSTNHGLGECEALLGNSTSHWFCADGVQTMPDPGRSLLHLPCGTRAVFISYNQMIFFFFHNLLLSPLVVLTFLFSC